MHEASKLDLPAIEVADFPVQAPYVYRRESILAKPSVSFASCHCSLAKPSTAVALCHAWLAPCCDPTLITITMALFRRRKNSREGSNGEGDQTSEGKEKGGWKKPASASSSCSL